MLNVSVTDRRHEMNPFHLIQTDAFPRCWQSFSFLFIALPETASELEVKEVENKTTEWNTWDTK